MQRGREGPDSGMHQPAALRGVVRALVRHQNTLQHKATRRFLSAVILQMLSRMCTECPTAEWWFIFPRPPVNGAEIRQSGANQRGKHRRFSSLD